MHCTTQRTHARLFLERGAAFLPSFPQPSGEYKFEFEFESSSTATFTLSSEVADTLWAEVGRLSKKNRTLMRQKVTFESPVLAYIQFLTEHAVRFRAGNVQLASLVKCNPNMEETIARRNAADAAAASGVAAVLDYA